MSLYKTNIHIKIYNGMICIHLHIAEFMRENKVLFAMMATPMSNIHTLQGGWKQQQHDDTAYLVLQFIIEEISVMMRKRLEMETKSYPKEEQHSSQLSLPFDFKIQCNQYHMSSKTSKAVPTEVLIREDRERTHHYLLIAAKDATNPARSAFPVFMIDNILIFLPPCKLFIFMTAIKICQKSLTYALVMKTVINYFRQIMTEHDQ